MSRTKDTNRKEKDKTAEKITRSITSKTQLKDVEIVNEILEQKADVQTPGAIPSTYTKIQLRNGTIKEVYGERYGRPNGG